MTQTQQPFSTSQALNDALLTMDATEFSQWIIDVLDKGYLDSYIKEIGRALFNRRDVLLGNPPKAPTPTPMQLPQGGTKQTPPQFTPKKKGFYDPNAPFASDEPAGNVSANNSPVPTADNKVQPVSASLLTSDTNHFVYRGKYYPKDAFKGKEFAMPYTVNPKYMTGVTYIVTGVGNKRLKVKLTSEPKVGTRFHNCYLQGTAVFLPLSYIAQLLEQ